MYLSFILFALLFLCSKSAQAETYYYNVKDFGADGTDTQSDSTAIQQALDKASDYLDWGEEYPEGKEPTTVITIPNGTYYISKPLYIQSNTTLKLSSKAVIIRMDSAQGRNMLRTTDAGHESDTFGKYELAHNITISGGTWDGGNISKASSTSNLIYIGHSSNITIKNTTIKNCYGAHAIEMAGVKDSAIRNCKISGFRYDSTMFTSEAIQIDICYESKSEGEWAPGFVVDKTTSTNIVIENNTITDYPRGIGIHHQLKGYQVSNITIRNNTFKRSSTSTQGKSVVGVYLLGVKNATITKNTFNHYYYGAMIKQSQNVTIKNNKFKYNSLGSLNIEGCDANNGKHAFRVTSDDIGKKTLKFSCGLIKSGTVKTKGRTYKFKASNQAATIKLKNKIKSNQKITFYGKDKYNNKYYRTYTVPKKSS
jgi:parallel beta-helix repeat protein